MPTAPEIRPEEFATIVSLIKSGDIASAVEHWTGVMEDRFMDGVAWEQDAFEPSGLYDRD